MRINLPINFSQWDNRWASLLLGFNTNTAYNFYNYACLITCLAMIARYYGHDDTPITINDKLKALGVGKGFQAGDGNYVHGGFNRIYSAVAEKRTVCPLPLTDEQLNEIRTALDNGYPVMVQLDYDPKDVDLDSHFVLLIDYNPSDENDLTILDPLGGVQKSLKAYLGWFRPSARKTVEQYIIFTGKIPASVKMVQVPADIYPNIIHNSTEYDKTVAYVLPGNDPKATSFEDVQKVIAGIKSEATAAKNERDELSKKLTVAEQEVKNRIDQIANIEDKCQREQKLLLAEITALKEAQPNTDKLVAQYKGTIEALEGQLREAQKQTGILQNKIAELEAGQKTLSGLEVFIKWVKSIWGN